MLARDRKRKKSKQLEDVPKIIWAGVSTHSHLKPPINATHPPIWTLAKWTQRCCVSYSKKISNRNASVEWLKLVQPYQDIAQCLCCSSRKISFVQSGYSLLYRNHGTTGADPEEKRLNSKEAAGKIHTALYNTIEIS